MNETEAMTRVHKMFLSHARAISPEIVGVYAEAVLEADCQSCMGEVLEQVQREGSKVPPVSGIWSLYLTRNSSPAHADHVGHDDVAVSVAKVETQWRTRGVTLIMSAGADSRAAKVAAARMWGSGSVTVDQAGEEWLAGVWTTTNPPLDQITTDLIEAWWDYARAVATTDPVAMTDDEWKLTVAKLERARAAVTS